MGRLRALQTAHSGIKPCDLFQELVDKQILLGDDGFLLGIGFLQLLILLDQPGITDDRWHRSDHEILDVLLGVVIQPGSVRATALKMPRQGLFVVLQMLLNRPIRDSTLHREVLQLHKHGSYLLAYSSERFGTSSSRTSYRRSFVVVL